jgi:quinol monooxygenase YgiN
MAKVVLIVRLRVKPGRGDDAAEVLSGLPGFVESEPGTEVFAAHRAVDDPDTFLFYEVYAHDDALRAHQAGGMVKEFGARLGDLVAAPPEITKVELLGAKGLPAVLPIANLPRRPRP